MAPDDVAAIERLKYAYLRLLDRKQFGELGELLTVDCTAAYDDGNLSYEGRDAIVAFLTEALGDPGIVTQHHCHHPEIDVLDAHDVPVRATGTWYLEDRVIVPAADLEIAGTAFYRDEYVRTDAGWLISHTGYERVFEEQRRHTTLELVSFRSRA